MRGSGGGVDLRLDPELQALIKQTTATGKSLEADVLFDPFDEDGDRLSSSTGQTSSKVEETKQQEDAAARATNAIAAADALVVDVSLLKKQATTGIRPLSQALGNLKLMGVPRRDLVVFSRQMAVML